MLMRKRDVTAMELLYDKYSPVLYGVIVWITEDDKKSEDILFKTFTYIWNHFDTFDETVHNICLWMIGIARRFSFETLSVEDRLKVKQQLMSTLRANWSPAQAEVLSYAFFKGISVERMSEKFGCTESNIRTLLHEAVNHLRKEYITR